MKRTCNKSLLAVALGAALILSGGLAAAEKPLGYVSDVTHSFWKPAYATPAPARTIAQTEGTVKSVAAPKAQVKGTVFISDVRHLGFKVSNGEKPVVKVSDRPAPTKEVTASAPVAPKTKATAYVSDVSHRTWNPIVREESKKEARIASTAPVKSLTDSVPPQKSTEGAFINKRNTSGWIKVN